MPDPNLPRLPAVLKADETDYWELPEHIRPYVKRVFGVYVFDRSAHSHCCEVTASYELTYAECQFDATPAYDDLDDTAREGIHDFFLENDVSEPVSYMHVHTVDAFPRIKEGEYPPEGAAGGVIELGEEKTPVDDVADEDMIEGIREWVCGNSV